MQNEMRRIGTIGTVSRVLVGVGLLYLALADGRSWGLAWHEAVLGLAVFPAVMIAVGIAARRTLVSPPGGHSPAARRLRSRTGSSAETTRSAAPLSRRSTRSRRG